MPFKKTLFCQTSKRNNRGANSLYRKSLLLGSMILIPMAYAPMAQAQIAQREIINPSFEDGPNPNNFVIGPDTGHPGWFSTNGTIETWRDGFQNRSAQEGTYLVELNPSAPVGLYQEICLINGETLSWDFQHSARTAGSAPSNQTVVYEVVSLDGNTTHQQLVSNTVTEQGNNNNQSQNDWEVVSDTAVYTGPTGIQRLQFRSTNGGKNRQNPESIQN